jgi:hypothetical protein
MRQRVSICGAAEPLRLPNQDLVQKFVEVWTS